MLPLTEYGFILQWRLGALHHVSDELFRLPHSQVPEADIIDAVPNDPSSGESLEHGDPKRPTLDGTFLKGERNRLQPHLQALPRHHRRAPPGRAQQQITGPENSGHSPLWQNRRCPSRRPQASVGLVKETLCAPATFGEDASQDRPPRLRRWANRLEKRGAGSAVAGRDQSGMGAFSREKCAG